MNDRNKADQIVSWLAIATLEQQEKFFSTLLGLLSNPDCEMVVRILEEMEASPETRRKLRAYSEYVRKQSNEEENF